jgi:hypothetical protein
MRIFGRKIITPIITLVIADINTAPAAMSLLCFARGCFSKVYKSTARSIAVLINSVDQTIPMTMKIRHHSVKEIFRITLNKTAKIVKKR